MVWSLRMRASRAALLERIHVILIGENNSLMEPLFGGGAHNNQIVPYGQNLTVESRQGFDSGSAAAEESGRSLNIRQLVRRYWLLLLVLLIVGAAIGFTSVVLSSPMYKARVLLEVQSSEGLLKDSLF